eukprot:scaffold436778_cov45-Prasinocladus_malaysianus.AAC.2
MAWSWQTGGHLTLLGPLLAAHLDLFGGNAGRSLATLADRPCEVICPQGSLAAGLLVLRDGRQHPGQRPNLLLPLPDKGLLLTLVALLQGFHLRHKGRLLSLVGPAKLAPLALGGFELPRVGALLRVPLPQQHLDLLVVPHLLPLRLHLPRPTTRPGQMAEKGRQKP